MPNTMSLQGHRLQLYGVFSTVLVSAVIASAFHKHSNFYSATVFLSRSSASVMVLANYGGFLTLLFGRLVQQIFFGRLTNQEVERLYDRTWFFLTESLLAFTIFRDEFDAPFVVMFAALLFLKCFHWLIADRIDWMDQQPYPGPSWLFHIRTNVLFGVLWTIDVLMLDFAVQSVLTNGVGGIILFGSEYAILLATLLNSMMKYGVMAYDLRRARNMGGEDAPVWENKSMYMFYIELLTDFLKLTTYLGFFTIVMTFFGLPLNIIRDVYMTGVSFYTRFRDLLRYRAATKDMETKYPDATEAELAALSDRTCIICRDEMVIGGPRHAHQQQAPVPVMELERGRDGLPTPGQTTLGMMRDPPKKLACGHCFHFQCLRSWLERQQSCPTCRRSVLEEETPVEGAANNAAAQAAQARGRAQPGRRARPAAPAPGAVPQANVPVATPGPDAVQLPDTPQTRAAALPQTQAQRARSPNPASGAAAAAIPRTFQGFNVGGKWHAWTVPGATPTPTTASGNGAVATPTLRAVNLEETGSTGSATPTGSATGPVEPATATAPVATSTESAAATATVPSAAEEGPSSDPVDPRQAAAQAALRRLGGVGASLAPPTPTAEALSSTSSPSSVPAPVPVASTSSSQPSTSSQASSSKSPIPSTSTLPTHAQVPALIPLFDPSSVTNRPFLNLNLTGLGFPGVDVFDVGTPLPTPGAMTPAGGLEGGRGRTWSTSSLAAGGSFPWASSMTAVAAGGRTPGGSFSQLGMSGMSQTPARVSSTADLGALAGYGGGQAPMPTPIVQSPPSSFPSAAVQSPTSNPLLSRAPSAYFSNTLSPTAPLELPSALTDDAQLRRLDAWTREAIDERLRVLEDVQRSLWRAAEELQKVRSTMGPAPPPQASTAAASEMERQDTEKGVGAVDVKGKGKARAVFDVQEELEADVAARTGTGTRAVSEASDESSE